MALGVIFQTLPEDVTLQMSRYSEQKDVWEALKVRYISAERTQKARVQMLRAELDGLKMGETESIDDYAAKLGGVQSKYKSLGAVLKEEVFVRKFLNSLPYKYLPVVSSMKLLADIEIMEFEDVVGRLRHMKKETICSLKKTSLNEERVIPGVFEKDEKNEGTWYLDNGVSHHMSGKKEFFTTLDERVSAQVKFGDGSEIEIKGKGNVTMVSKTGEKKTFCDVFYMPKLKTNLLSLGQLDEEECKIEIANGILKLYDQKKRLLIKIQRNLNRMYNIKLQVCCNPNNFEVEKKVSYDVKPIMKVKDIRFGTIPNDLIGVRESIGKERVDEKNRVEKENSNVTSKLSTK
ncbi:uncharacterized protein LOC143530876 [Bidens hawaiensis]|uniref:uncharacterized protein LOC143530876 n=1 Tax=Bidens hawaiensis TaxID=980011 RepID=UPI00404B2813